MIETSPTHDSEWTCVEKMLPKTVKIVEVICRDQNALCKGIEICLGKFNPHCGWLEVSSKGAFHNVLYWRSINLPPDIVNELDGAAND